MSDDFNDCWSADDEELGDLDIADLDMADLDIPVGFYGSTYFDSPLTEAVSVRNATRLEMLRAYAKFPHPSLFDMEEARAEPNWSSPGWTEPTQSPIHTFEGKFRFLSNFALTPLTIGGMEYPSGEHAYQAHKAQWWGDHQLVASVAHPYTAKQVMRTLPIRDDWDYERLSVMWRVVKAKFSDPVLRQALLATGTRKLIEGNSWGDTYWGRCGGIGENHLGLMLMDLRGRFQAEGEGKL